MKEMSKEEMILVEGGNFVGGFCSVWGGLAAGAWIAVQAGLAVASSGTSAFIAGGISAACGLYGLYSIG